MHLFTCSRREIVVFLICAVFIPGLRKIEGISILNANK